MGLGRDTFEHGILFAGSGYLVLSFAALKPSLCLLGLCHSYQAAGLSRGIMARRSHRCSAAFQECKALKLQQPVEAGGAGMGCPARAASQIVVPLPSPHLAHPCQGPSAGGSAMALWTLPLYLGLDGAFMELASAWMRFAMSLPVLQAEPPGPCLLSPDSRLAQAA